MRAAGSEEERLQVVNQPWPDGWEEGEEAGKERRGCYGDFQGRGKETSLGRKMRFSSQVPCL